MTSGDLKSIRLSRAQVYLWLALAVISLGWGFYTALKPGHSQDLQIVNTWLRTWLWEGSNPYYLPIHIIANYPPHGIVALSPVALIPESYVAALWAVFNLLLAPLVAYTAWRAMRPEADKETWKKTALLPCVMFLAWAGLRAGIGNGQFTLLILGLGLLAFLVEEKRPLLGGVLLALALSKPHIGGAFLLWAVFTKRWKMTLVACALMGLGVGLFALRLGENPVASVRSFLAVIQRQFGSGAVPEEMSALRVVELRPFVEMLIPHDAWANRVHQLLLVILLGCVFAAAVVKTRLSRRRCDCIILQLCCLWLLMSVFHNPYDTILLLPLLMMLWNTSVPHPQRERRWMDDAALWVLQLAMVVALPSIWWKASKMFDLSAYGWAGGLLLHFDRLLVLALFCYLLNRVRLYWLAARDTSTAGEMLAQPSTPNP